MSGNSVIDKLRKLIAHERSARSIGNMHEAEAFAGKIQDLLTTHKLSMSEVDFQAQKDGEPIDWERVDGEEINAGGVRVRVFWRALIAQTIAETNCCVVVNRYGDQSCFFFVGRTSDRQLCKTFYLYLVELGEYLVDKADHENRYEQKQEYLSVLTQELLKKFGNSTYSYEIAEDGFKRWMKDFRESWKIGYATAVHARLKERHNAAVQEAQATSIGAGAIVLVKRDAIAVREHLKGKTHKGRGNIKAQNRSGDGYVQGLSMGGAVNLSPNTLAGKDTKQIGG